MKWEQVVQLFEPLVLKEVSSLGLMVDGAEDMRANVEKKKAKMIEV